MTAPRRRGALKPAARGRTAQSRHRDGMAVVFTAVASLTVACGTSGSDDGNQHSEGRAGRTSASPAVGPEQVIQEARSDDGVAFRIVRSRSSVGADSLCHRLEFDPVPYPDFHEVERITGPAWSCGPPASFDDRSTSRLTVELGQERKDAAYHYIFGSVFPEATAVHIRFADGSIRTVVPTAGVYFATYGRDRRASRVAAFHPHAEKAAAECRVVDERGGLTDDRCTRNS